MSDASVKEIFLSRVRSLLEVLSSRNSGDKESLEHDFDDLYTRANLLYHHGVCLASVHMIEESTITKLRNVVDLLTEKRDSEPVPTGLGAIPSEFEALELSSVTTSCRRALHFSKVLADSVFTFAILISLPPISSQTAQLLKFGSSLN